MLKGMRQTINFLPSGKNPRENVGDARRCPRQQVRSLRNDVKQYCIRLDKARTVEQTDSSCLEYSTFVIYSLRFLPLGFSHE